MPSWNEFEAAAPTLAAEVHRRLDAYTHKTLATLRRDGAPRISGTETESKDGEYGRLSAHKRPDRARFEVARRLLCT